MVCWFHHTAVEFSGRADAILACRARNHAPRVTLPLVGDHADKLRPSMEEVKLNRKKRGLRRAFLTVGLFRSVHRRDDELGAVLDARRAPAAASRRGRANWEPSGQFIVGMTNSAPSLMPDGQREVTVLVLV